MSKTGPGIVLAASIVGSGELILTTTLGAKVGYTVMWLIILSCLIKAVVQSFLGRYTIAMGETGLDAFNRIPGKHQGGLGGVGLGSDGVHDPVPDQRHVHRRVADHEQHRHQHSGHCLGARCSLCSRWCCCSAAPTTASKSWR